MKFKLLRELNEFLLEKVSSTSLYEMAVTREKAYNTCNNLINTLSEHLLKVLIMPSSVCIPHWKSEINNYLSEMVVIQLKPKNKRLKTETYKEWLIEKSGFTDDKIRHVIQIIRKKYSKEEINIPEIIIQDYRNIMEKICIDLGNNIITEI